jgi:3-isopropylmalate dehydrogenase
MDSLITLLPGDGIGPEVTTSAHRVLKRVGDVFGHAFRFNECLIGGAAIDATGSPLPPDTIASALESSAVFLGAVGGPKWSDPQAAVRPEQGLLDIRAKLGVYANIRPVRVLEPLLDASPLKPEIIAGVDLVVVRELTGGIYFGDKKREETVASDVCIYHTHEIERIVRVAARLAQRRRKKLCSVDKANILETSRLWREVTDRTLQREFAELDTETLLVDAAAMHLLRRPADFDVIVTENMFGDILTDEASMLAGSMGMLPSASLGDAPPGLYEPIHGSAPDIAGKDLANPCGAIGSVALLLRHSLELDEEAEAVENAVAQAIAAGARTADIAGPGDKTVGTIAMTEQILAAIS